LQGVLDTTLHDTFFRRLASGRWFSPCTPVSPNNKTDRHDRTEIILKEKVEDTNGVFRIRKSIVG